MLNYLSIDQYLPHKDPMIFVDEIVSINDTTAVTKCFVDKNHRLGKFLDTDESLDNCYCLEIMAQTIGIFAGFHKIHNLNKKINLGLLLGARNIKFNCQKISANSNLIVTATRVMHDNNFACFQTNINCNDQIIVSGYINSFDVDPKFLAQYQNNQEVI